MLRFIAQFFSVICHPLLILTYMLIILLTVNPYLFGTNNIGDNGYLIMMVFFSTVFIPGFAILMMRTLGMVGSLELPDQKERIMPYIITGIFYMWMFRTILDNPNIPLAFKVFVLGATIALFLCFFINLFTKISMHTAGMGGLVAMILITMTQYSYGDFWVDMGTLGKFQMSMTALLMLAIFLAGAVATARLILKAHAQHEVYGGFLVGFAAQFIALFILL